MNKNKIANNNLNNYISNFFSNKYNKVIFGFISIGLILMLSIFIVKNKMFDKKQNLEDSLKEMAIDFYENFYYDQVKQISSEEEYLSRFESIGIKISLKNLEEYDNGKYNLEIKKFINSKTKVSCNKYNTEALIYPKKPYRKTDYEIEVKLECEEGNNID